MTEAGGPINNSGNNRGAGPRAIESVFCNPLIHKELLPIR